MAVCEPIRFTGAEGNLLVGDLWGAGSGPSALMLHGGGQTRHSWESTARRLAGTGWRVATVDQRGHGDSAYSAAGNYTYSDFAADAAAVGADLQARFGSRAVAIGASLGGISLLLAHDRKDGALFSGLVLVDVTPRMERNGVARVESFMAAHMGQGFASLDEAAEAIAAYLPHRKRPRSVAGLKKNLRRGSDGRFRWHWDPRFLAGPRPVSTDRGAYDAELEMAARRLVVPTLLVRGRMSELVGERQVRAFQDLVPHAAHAEVSGAGHMVAGDRNDPFADAVLEFLSRLEAA